jgi:hypothetical protein
MSPFAPEESMKISDYTVPLPAPAIGLAWGFYLLASGPVATAQTEGVPGSAPAASSVAADDRIHSIGQPRSWAAFGGIEFVASTGPRDLGTELLFGARRPLFHPTMGLLSARIEAFGDPRAPATHGGLRFLLESPVFFVEGGTEVRATGSRSARVGVSVPAARGGWPVPGAFLRGSWSSGAGGGIRLGVSAPIGDPLAGRTRPRDTGIRFPTASRPGAVPPKDGPGAEVLRSMAWIHALHNLYWLTDRTGIAAHERALRSRQVLSILLAELREREVLRPGSGSYRREVEHYHESLVRWFATATTAADAPLLAAEARRAMLDELVLPYNRAIGQRKVADRVDGLAERARRHFAVRIAAILPDSAGSAEAALGVFDAWAIGFEEARRALSQWTGDSRVQWIPLALVLRPEEHETADEVRTIIERALGSPFTTGNQVQYIDAHAFQAELVRTLRQAERHHLLWIHDFRGRTEEGAPDRSAFEAVTHGYLPALIEGVRQYDARGYLPAFFILLDQFFYEENGGRVWMDLLENPLRHEVKLPGRPVAMEAVVRALQQELRDAVAGSARLQAESNRYGRRWLHDRVRVHVNITNPSDFTFRSRHLLRFPVGADNAMRDHRKIIARDLDPLDPQAGEAILTGMGVGDHYTDPGWEDRSLLIRGPAAHEAMVEAQRVLEAHGLRGERLPAVFRAFDERTRGGDDVPPGSSGGASVLQVHNRTGWDRKDASFLQMLLYDLLPPGTVVYVPDSLWTSPEWMAQLVGAALRGCRVYIVAPALEHAPAPGYPQMSESRELLTALLIVREVLGTVIEEAGGELQVGLYARSTSTEDAAGRVAELTAGYDRHPVPGSLFPLQRVPVAAAPPEPASRTPMLHQKTQLFASAELVAALSRSPEVAAVLERMARGAETERADEERVLAAYRALPESLRTDAVLYLLVGSLNKNVRSMALDGEAVAAVSGENALVGFLDFLLLTGSIRWVDEVSGLDHLLPPYSDLRRFVGRWLLRVL